MTVTLINPIHTASAIWWYASVLGLYERGWVFNGMLARVGHNLRPWPGSGCYNYTVVF
jgi:hypothetical protein